MTGPAILVVEDEAHRAYGHFPLLFAELADALRDAGCTVTVLTSRGWALAAERSASPPVLQYGRLGLLGVRAADLLARLPPTRYLRRIGAVARDVVVVLVVRRLAGRLRADGVIVTSYRFDPFVAAALAGDGRWLCYEFAPPDQHVATGPRRFRGWPARGGRPSAALEALGRRSQARRLRNGGTLRVAPNNEHTAGTWQEAHPWLLPVELPFAACRQPDPAPNPREALGLDGERRVALLFGSPHPMKDLEVVWRAFRSLDDWTLVVAGGGSADAYRAWQARTGPGGRAPVVLEGFVDNRTRDLLYAAADLVVLSFVPGSPLDSGTLVDAIAWGRPIVCSDDCFAARAVGRLELGGLFRSGDERSLRDAVRACPTGLAADVVRRARDEFSPERMARRHLDALFPRSVSRLTAP